MIRAAGILYVTPDGRALFLQRAGTSDAPGTWCFPGGCLEDGETEAQAAQRESQEEIGHRPPLAHLKEHTRTIRTAPAVLSGPADASASVGMALPVLAEAQTPAPVDYTTFICRVNNAFEVELNDEHTGYAWAPIANPPQPMHPGAQIALSRLSWDELEVAEAMRDGLLTSPQRYDNVTLWDMRITGTGMAYRQAINEYVWRDPDLYMTERFLQRCNGLAVIFEHPKGSMLNSREFNERVVGAVLLPYLKPDINEVWGIVKVYDEATNHILADRPMSTSPAVVFRDLGVNTKMTMEDGSVLLIEGKPSLLDHLAICEVGVWDKGGEPAGIVIADHQPQGGATVPDEDKKDDAVATGTGSTAADTAAIAADSGAAILGRLDSILGRMDTLSARMDSIEAGRADAAAKADEDDKDDEKKGDADEDDEGDTKDKPKEVAADKRRKDSDDEEDGKKGDSDDEDDKRDDSVSLALADSQRTISHLQSQVNDMRRLLPKQLTDEDHREMAAAQGRADTVFQAFGDHAPRPLLGEDLTSYRRRLVDKLKAHSPKWGNVNLHAVADAAAFEVIEAGVYADAMDKALSPVEVTPGTLREIVEPDITGRRSIRFAGEPKAWMAPFTGRARQVLGISKDGRL